LQLLCKAVFSATLKTILATFWNVKANFKATFGTSPLIMSYLHRNSDKVALKFFENNRCRPWLRSYGQFETRLLQRLVEKSGKAVKRSWFNINSMLQCVHIENFKDFTAQKLKPCTTD
jgi:hypothetical protein